MWYQTRFKPLSCAAGKLAKLEFRRLHDSDQGFFWLASHTALAILLFGLHASGQGPPLGSTLSDEWFTDTP